MREGPGRVGGTRNRDEWEGCGTGPLRCLNGKSQPVVTYQRWGQWQWHGQQWHALSTENLKAMIKPIESWFAIVITKCWLF